LKEASCIVTVLGHLKRIEKYGKACRGLNGYRLESKVWSRKKSYVVVACDRWQVRGISLNEDKGKEKSDQRRDTDRMAKI
jgi:hypothetical protein